MTETEFQNEEFEFLENLENSSLYQRMKELSRTINARLFESSRDIFMSRSRF